LAYFERAFGHLFEKKTFIIRLFARNASRNMSAGFLNSIILYFLLSTAKQRLMRIDVGGRLPTIPSCNGLGDAWQLPQPLPDFLYLKSPIVPIKEE